MAILTTKRVERERFELKVQTVKTNLLIGVVIACTALLVQAQDRKTTQSQALSRLDRLSGDLKELKRSNRELLRTVAQQKQQIEALTQQLSTSRSEITKLSDSLRNTASDVASVNQDTQGQ